VRNLRRQMKNPVAEKCDRRGALQEKRQSVHIRT
jgi:hypothetical protein